MNKTRNLFAAVLALLLCLSLVGCGEKEAKEPAKDPTAVTTNLGEIGDTTGTTEAEKDTTDVTQPQETTQGTEATTPVTESTTPNETKPNETKPGTTTTPAAGEPALNYVQYMNLSSDEQQKLYDKYFTDNPLAFATWFQRIQAEYEDDTPSIIVTGPVDIGDYINP